MSSYGIWYPIKSGNLCWKMIYTTTCTGECNQISKIQSIGGSVELNFKEEAKTSGDTQEIKLKYRLRKCASDQPKYINVNIACEDLNFSEIGVAAPKHWSEWELMGIWKPIDKSEQPKFYMYATSISVSVYEVQLNTISTNLYKDTEFTDFDLCATDGKVAVHKTFLVAHSDVFKAMLTKEWKETNEGQISMKGVTIQTLQHLKDYMYLGTVPNEGLRPLLLIARFYLIEELEKHCIRKLAETVTGEELFSLIDYACENQIPELPFAMMQLTQDSVVDRAHVLKRALVKQNETNGKL